MVYDPGATQYDDITSVAPVGKILRITNTNPAKIYFKDADWYKFKKGDIVQITRQDTMQGYEMFDLRHFALDNPNEKELNFFLRTFDEKTVDASHLPYEVKNGFAQLVATADQNTVVPEAKDLEGSARKNAKSPSKV